MNKTLSKLTKTFVIILVMLTQSVTLSAKEEPQLITVEKQNEKLVRAFFASLGQKDMAQVHSYLTDDFSFQNAMNGKRQHGKKVFTDWWMSMVSNATVLEPKISRLKVMGDIVIFQNTFYYEDTNNSMTFKGTKFVSIKDGKIHEYQEYRLPKV